MLEELRKEIIAVIIFVLVGYCWYLHNHHHWLPPDPPAVVHVQHTPPPQHRVTFNTARLLR